MGDLDRLRLEAFVRAVEKHLGRPLAPDEVEQLAKRLAENRPLEWMRAFVERQGTKMLDFDAIYQRKSELDGEPHDHRPKRRWFRFSLRKLLLWDLPFAALIAATLAPVVNAPRPASSLIFLSHDDFARAIGYGVLVELALIFALMWLLLPIAWWLAARLWKTSRARPNRPARVTTD